jgi:membrane-associated phospholipid phosphatase
VATSANTGPRVDPTVDAESPRGWRHFLEQLGHYEQARLAEFSTIVIGGFVLAAVLLYAFSWLATEVLQQETQALDMSTLNYLQSFSSPGLTLAANLVSAMGSQVVIVVGVVLLGVFLYQRRWGAAVTLVMVTAGAQLLNDVLKQSFHRARPTPLTGLIEAQQFSFPSGHAMVSAAFYLYIAYLTWRLVHGHFRGVLVAGLIVLVLLIGLARLYLEAHFLSDVIAGYMAGFLWTDAVVLGGRVLTIRRRRQVPAVAAPARS